MHSSEANLPMDDLWYGIGKRTVGLECGTPFGRNKSVLKKDVGVLFLVSRWLHTSERGGAAMPTSDDQHGPAVWAMDALSLRRRARLKLYQTKIRALE
jgi:hypothetical protein